ncbi:hypothetical protein [Pyxidicoccus parkwayensis]|uniref:hypothetical protein n=1 Tax=Pyxidicoccus parkwayensis TaxID=2813578 RepID=UPI001F50E9E2|nr:hypothetical protein [Pyxidicoccus parkwaysis]
MKQLLACGVMLVSLTGCFRMSVRSGAPRSGDDVEEQTGVSLAYGLTTSNVAAAECPNGLSRVDVYWPVWGPIVYFFTLGIVAPLRAEYVCAEGGTAGPSPARPVSGEEEAPLPPGVPPSHPPL